MSSIKITAADVRTVEDSTPGKYQRVSETKNVLPEDYKCRTDDGNKTRCPKKPLLDETICKPIPSNKLNETLKKMNCAHCGQVDGQCQCTSDESRREQTRINQNLPPEQENTTAEETTTENK
ncbi:hypothetical protein WA026_011006 [Henosepilachna vigintioctopunctata]|uniref:Uncharacterized protein n=1 Tax=Henosepilachna vigintioctopunctata TaxID=420089 RepID=A0AAW1UYC9_9CUCU